MKYKTPQANQLLDLANENASIDDNIENLLKIEKKIKDLNFFKPIEEYPNTIISIEGINGSLKSTLINKLTSDSLKKLRYRLDEINKLDFLNNDINENFANKKKKHYYNVEGMSQLSQVLFMSSYGMSIWETLNEKPIGNVLVDRLHDSSISIQNLQLVEAGIDSNYALSFLNTLYNSLGHPNKTIILNFPVKSCINRILKRELENNRERENLDDFNDLYLLNEIQEKLIKSAPERYITMQNPDLLKYWEKLPDLNYNLEGLTKTIKTII